jgi:sulfonate transport system substrate-binding protein
MNEQEPQTWTRSASWWRGAALAATVASVIALVLFFHRRAASAIAPPKVVHLTCTAAATGERAFSGLTAVIVAQGWLEAELAKRGARIEWVPVSGAAVGPIVNEGFANHTIDVANYGDLPSIIANAAGVRTELIVPNGRGSDTYLVVPPDSTATSLRDLKGKSIAIHRGRPWELPFSRLVGSLGFTYDDFNVLNLNPQAGAAALAAHKVDALYTILPELLEQKGIGKVIWSTAEAPADWKMRAEVWASRDFVRDNPELTQVIATAYVKAAHWASEDRSEMLKILSNTGTPVDVLGREYGDGEAWRNRWSPLFDEPVLLHYKNAISYAHDRQMISRELDFAECYDPQFAKAALEQLGLVGYWRPWAPEPVSARRPGE